MISFQTAGIDGTKLDAPETDKFPSDDDAPLSQKIFNVSVTQIESIVEPDGIGNDIWRESVAFKCIHRPILAIVASKLGDIPSVDTSILDANDCLLSFRVHYPAQAGFTGF